MLINIEYHESQGNQVGDSKNFRQRLQYKTPKIDLKKLTMLLGFFLIY